MEKKSETLIAIQNALSVPKNQRNTFGNYNYRSCEDILEAVKPLLQEHGAYLILSDHLEMIGERYYIRAVASLYLSDNTITVEGWAREEETKKGMDGSQITGASSSYARKYALNGLFLIDDSRDSDTTNQGYEPKEQKTETLKPKAQSTSDDNPKMSCPVCNGAMWDNRAKKASGEHKPNAPDYRCKDKNCSGTHWPSKKEENEQPVEAVPENGKLSVWEVEPKDRKETEQVIIACYRDVGFDAEAIKNELHGRFGYRIFAKLNEDQLAIWLIEAQKLAKEEYERLADPPFDCIPDGS